MKEVHLLHFLPKTNNFLEIKKKTTVTIEISNKYVQVFRWLIPRVLSIIFVIVLIVWLTQVEGGIGFHESNLFGFHGLFMGLFVVVFLQEAILSFTSPLILGPFRDGHNSTAVVVYHLICHFLGIVCAALGIVAIVRYKELAPQPATFPMFTCFSPHSWLGIALFSLWGIQLIDGIFVFFMNRESQVTLTKIHRFLGKLIYGVGLAVCALGFQDMQSSDLASSTAPMAGDAMNDMPMGNDMPSMMYTVNGSLMNMTGYFPHSMYAQYASGASVILLFLGIAVFGVIHFKI